MVLYYQSQMYFLDSDYIIERSGENFRKIMLTFEDETGKSMCSQTRFDSSIMY